MITEKGSTNSLNKLFDILGSENESALEFNEEWAIRVARYGASEIFEVIEFILDEDKFKLEPQPFETVEIIDLNKRDFVIRQTKNDLYLKPQDFIIDIWPKNINPNEFLKTAGFCKIEFAKLILNDLDDILTKQTEGQLNINDLVSGDYIWCGFQKKINRFDDDWNIFRYNNLHVTVISVVENNNDLYITLDKWPNFIVDEIIVITSSYDKLNQFVQIKELPTDPNTFVITKTNQFQISEIANKLNSIKIFNITENRLKNIDEYIIPKYINLETNEWPYGELTRIS